MIMCQAHVDRKKKMSFLRHATFISSRKRRTAVLLADRYMLMSLLSFICFGLFFTIMVRKINGLLAGNTPTSQRRRSWLGGKKTVASSSLTRPPQERASSRPVAKDLETTPEISRHVYIEYCTGCQWGLRSFWMAQELLQLEESRISSVSLIPNRSKPGGVFRIFVSHVGTNDPTTTIWDRKVDGGFPEIQALQERIFSPSPQPWSFWSRPVSDTLSSIEDQSAVLKQAYPQVCITYDPSQRLLARSVYTGSELLLSTFTGDLLSCCTIQPTNTSSYRISLVEENTDDDSGSTEGSEDHLQATKETMLWDSLRAASLEEASAVVKDTTASMVTEFPDVVQLKRRLRDILDPSKDLGHVDSARKKKDPTIVLSSSTNATQTLIAKAKDEQRKVRWMDDEDAENARRFFGVF
jgi:selT/selW/selH-like putative selenoprotein